MFKYGDEVVDTQRKRPAIFLSYNKIDGFVNIKYKSSKYVCIRPISHIVKMEVYLSPLYQIMEEENV